MKRMFFYFFLLILSSCGGEPKTDSDAEVATTKVETSTPKAVTGDKKSTVNAQPEAAEGLIERNGPGLNLWIDGGMVSEGGKICVQVLASGMKQVLSMQYSVRWDPKVLHFSGIKGFNLSSLDKNDFGTNRVNEGVLTAVWIEDNLRGVDLDAKRPIYELCFDAVGTVGSQSSVRFWSTPTPFESVVAPERVVPISPHKGEIKVVKGK